MKDKKCRGKIEKEKDENSIEIVWGKRIIKYLKRKGEGNWERKEGKKSREKDGGLKKEKEDREKEKYWEEGLKKKEEKEDFLRKEGRKIGRENR